MFGDIGKMIKQAKDLQDNMAKMQEELAAVEVSGKAGGDMVTVTLNGKGNMTAVKIDPSLMQDEAEIIEDLIVAAHTDAKASLETTLAEKMQDVTQGIQLPPGMMPNM